MSSPFLCLGVFSPSFFTTLKRSGAVLSRIVLTIFFPRSFFTPHEQAVGAQQAGHPVSPPIVSRLLLNLSAAACVARRQSFSNYPTVELTLLKEMAQELAELL